MKQLSCTKQNVLGQRLNNYNTNGQQFNRHDIRWKFLYWPSTCL